MVKKANIGALIPNKQTPTGNKKPKRIDDAFLYDSVAGMTGKESYDEMMARMKAEAQAAAGQQSGGGGGGGMGGMMAMLPQMMEMFGGAGGDGDLRTNTMLKHLKSFKEYFTGQISGSFKPHMMYDPKTKKGKKVKTLKII